jgi:hypothetical protein
MRAPKQRKIQARQAKKGRGERLKNKKQTTFQANRLSRSRKGKIGDV